ncbi:MAG: HAMP domain-containing histidine kinase [Lachnospiraceae bacterium]|nr:HAMP domain-containing histidine kinase [Lachnospiraceae bacterium]
MKNYYKIVIVIAILYFLAVLVLGFYVSREDSSDSVRGRDITILNDISMNAGEYWNNLEKLKEKDYNADYVILNTENAVLFSSINNQKSDEVYSVQSAIKKGYPYAYVIINNTVRGSVILLEDGLGRLHSLRNGMILGIAVFGVILVFIACIYGKYIEKNIVNPFDNMKDFAGRIAEGKLDEVLVMEKNNMFGTFTESFDIMREELNASRKREVELQRRERELVASLSHDLKTPITGIKVTTELLKAKVSAGKTDGMDEKLDNIYKKAEQIDVLVSDLFSSTLEDLGEFKVSCSDEKASVLGDIVAKYDDKSKVAATEIPNVLIRIDTKRMSQVIGNIISNSYKYAGTKIDVSYRIEEEFLEMTIRDYGPGVPEEELSLIANKFYRGKQWANSKEEGSGLGLYIAKMLMEKMDGELLPESKGDGLSITLLIPLS